LANPLVIADEDAGNTSVAGFVTDFAPGPAMATDEAGQTLVFVVTVIGTTGTLAFDVEPSIDPLTGELSFASAADTYGAATIEVLLRDSGSGTLPNVNESAAQQFTIEIAPINDEQLVAVNLGLTAERGSTTAITSEALETTDIDNSPAELLYTVTVAPSHGSILVDGAPSLQFTQEQIDAGMVTYQNDGTANWTDSFDFEVDDGQGATSSGTFNLFIQPYPGDYNRDLVVNSADYILWRRTLGTTDLQPYSGADGNGDGTIDQDDYDVWRAHFGETWPAAEAAGAASGASVEDKAQATGSDVDAGEIAGSAIVPPAVDPVLPDTRVTAMRREFKSLDSVPAATLASFSGIAPSFAVAARDVRSTRLTSPRISVAPAVSRDVALVAWLGSQSAREQPKPYEGDLSGGINESESVDEAIFALAGAVDAAFRGDHCW
jgi:hypothetical protein